HLEHAGAEPDPVGVRGDPCEQDRAVRAPGLRGPHRVEARAFGLHRELCDVVWTSLPMPDVDPDPHARRLPERASLGAVRQPAARSRVEGATAGSTRNGATAAN